MTTLAAIDPETLIAAQKFAERVRARYPVSKILLYGSRARGDHQPDSDLDIAVILSDPKRRRIEVALEMGDLASDILLDNGLFLTPYPIWLDEWESPDLVFNPWLIRNIKRDGIAL